MPVLLENLDTASGSLRRIVKTASRFSGSVAPVHAFLASPQRELPPTRLRPVCRDSARDQTISALEAVVFVAALVQSVCNEIRGNSAQLG